MKKNITNEEKRKNITIEGARIIFRNFSGEPGRFNDAGNRNFCVIIDDELADDLKVDGWNVRYLKPREEDESPTPYIKVNVKYGKYPPKIAVLSEHKKKMFTESDVSKLDWMTFANVDLIISPYEYDTNKFSAYLKTFYGTLLEDELDMKYASVEEDELPFEE